MKVLRMMMMQIENLHDFLVDYFTASQCQVEVINDTISIQLTEEMDERLMNRPFYWHYIRKLNQTGQPLQLKITTNHSSATKEIDYIYYTTDRFQKIAEDTIIKGRYCKLYENIRPTKQTPLYPWLVINIKQTYLGKKQAEQLLSLGINLINGTIIDQAIFMLKTKQFNNTVPDLCYLITPIIKPTNGYDRIENYLINQLQRQAHEWASDSYRSLTEEIKLLNYFKERNPNMDEDHYEKEKENLQAIYQPKIKLEVINGGLFYLQQNS